MKSLAKDIKIVAYARFNKSKRLKRKSQWSMISIIFVSLVLILLSISEKVFGIKFVSPIICVGFLIPSWLFSVFSSITVLVISVAISSAKYDSYIEKLNDSALRLNSLYRSLDSDISDSRTYSKSYYNSRYQTILLENTVNHDELDYRCAKAAVNKEKVCFWDSWMNSFILLIPYFLSVFISFSVFYSILKQVVFLND